MALDRDGGRATLVRTNIGLARDHAPLGWTYVCPSQWGEHEQARAAYCSATATTVMVGGGDLYRSQDGACSFTPLEVDEPWYGLDAYATAEDVWLPALHEVDADVSGLLRVSRTGEVTVAARWDAEAAFRCDSVISDKAEVTLFAAGANPVPSLWRASTPEDTTAPLHGTTEVLEALSPDTSHIELRRIDESGDIWLVAATPEGRELWRGEPSGPDESLPVTWTRQGTPASSLLGPARLDDTWLVVRDGTLESTQGDQWTPLGEVDWTCLDEVSGAVIACRLTEVIQVLEVEGEAPETRQLFDMLNLLAPLEGCPASPEAHTACESDWIHFGAEVGLLDTEQLSTPAYEMDTPAVQAVNLQGCEAGGGLPLGMVLIALAFYGLMRRRRRTLCGGSSTDV